MTTTRTYTLGSIQKNVLKMPAQLPLPGRRMLGSAFFGSASWKPRPQMSSPAPSGYGFERPAGAPRRRRTRVPKLPAVEEHLEELAVVRRGGKEAPVAAERHRQRVRVLCLGDLAGRVLVVRRHHARVHRLRRLVERVVHAERLGD